MASSNHIIELSKMSGWREFLCRHPVNSRNRKLIRYLDQITDSRRGPNSEAVPYGGTTLQFCPRGRLGTRARRGVVRAKRAVYSGEALISDAPVQGSAARSPSPGQTENRTHHVGTLSAL